MVFKQKGAVPLWQVAPSYLQIYASTLGVVDSEALGCKHVDIGVIQDLIVLLDLPLPCCQRVRLQYLDDTLQGREHLDWRTSWRMGRGSEVGSCEVDDACQLFCAPVGHVSIRVQAVADVLLLLDQLEDVVL